MSQLSEYSTPHQCQWNWCRNTYPTVGDLLAHVREHVRQTKPCHVRDLPDLRRIEDGIGESLSGIAIAFSSYQSVAQSNLAPNLSSQPFQEASSSGSQAVAFQEASSSAQHALAATISPQDISSPRAALPMVDFSLLPDTPSRPPKRRKIDNGLSSSPLNSAHTPSPRGLGRTPGFASLALPDSTQPIPNPEFPDFDALVSKTLAGASAQNHFTAPNGQLPGTAGSQAFDAPIEDVLPNFAGLGDSQNLYAGELNWDDGPVPTLPRSRSQTPLQSQSQSQPRSSASSVDAALLSSQPLPLQRRQSWYQSPRRVSNGKKTSGIQQASPLSGLAGGQHVSSPITPSRPRIQSPAKTYLSGSLKMSSPDSHTPPYGDAINPRVLHQSQYPESCSLIAFMADLAVTTIAPTDFVVVVFIHGFKGTDSTFGEFPARLKHILMESIPNTSVECIVFPAYETKGELTEAVVKFADWLTTLTVEKEVASGGGAGKVKIVLCGHSMGGLLAADTLQEFMKSRETQAKFVLWPNIVSVIAFDTPYLGLHPGVFKNSATKAVEFAQAARSVGSGLLGAFAGGFAGASKASTPATTPPAAAPASAWGKWAGTASYAVGGALLAGAAAGATYYKRDDLGLGYTWATDHMKYVSHLWDVQALNRRVDFLVDAEEKEGVLFRNFYTYLPPTPLLSASERTFIVLPKKNARAERHFVLARNGLAVDEVEAHTKMFSGKTNDGYYDLGLQTAQVIREAVASRRGDVLVDTAASVPPEVKPAEQQPAQTQAPEMVEWGKEWQ
ncbi:DUF676 domain-containing protein [Mycena sanguinolenta]|uniref:DUF676 domain-containing protein n=1 Tax=Mycena sanguinolenta TaxID=230812 RepID=A0A8H6Y723_9AGAR|nr:DUF676 domain-containing protein [Mycena sanguinolenta]